MAFYRKPKPETMRKNRELYKEAFKDEIAWCKENVSKLTQNKHKFLIDMYTILITGSRKITPKMATAIANGIDRCKSNPHFNEDVREYQEAKLKPILEKITMVESMADIKNDRALEFVRNVKDYVKNNYRITKKQMDGLNKVYKRCSEDLFKGDDKND